ncbi:MAG: DNA repair protein RecN [Desulfosalsimonadaceae bacterium]|nr:DNA repair protein RecN [Desulfosalsimonadaceae bacterium]
MLTELSIKNFAIIDDVAIQFSEGLTILSGETGAGKSIIINAVNLILGSRATSKMIRTGAETAEIDALFHIPPTGSTVKILADQGIEPSTELLIRRIISKNDRHRVYINGRLSTMQTLNEVTENLAAISGQHEHQRLLNETSHLLILDQGGDHMHLRMQVSDCHHGILPRIQMLDELKANRRKQHDHLQLLEFQKKEIEDAGLFPDEDTALKQEQTRLKNAEMLYQTIQGSLEALYNGDGAVAERLGEVKRQVETAARIDTALASSAEGLSDAVFRIEDIARELQAYLDGIQFDPARLEAVAARLDQINRLKRKYGATIEDVLLYLENTSRELGDLENLDGRIAEMEQALDKDHQTLVRLAKSLSERRQEVAVNFARKVEAELHALKMPGTRFEIAFTETPATPKTSSYLTADGRVIAETGMEQAAFMIAPNVGEDLKPLSQIASGGELSRVVLALKSITANDASTGTMIFDEVDAGIGGDVAEVVGKKLSRLAGANQVICITHLAQIAAFGHHHYKISKHIENGRTFTRISSLTGDRRLEEIARMAGGEKITPATRNHAAEMLKNGREYGKGK